MNTFNKHRRPGTRRQRGAAAIDFALVSLAFFPLLIGVMEMGRVLFYWNTVGEATRLGARMAVVCDIEPMPLTASSPLYIKMQQMLPILQPGNINVAYTSVSVTVSIAGVSINTAVPFTRFTVTMPPFTTTLPTESLNSVGGTNPTCS
ncbi:pilus assembly protein TadG [Pandoraea terrae]|uniref:Pilus assembly protein TadG n=1 Tax=Pandoraea terrae TaxID=1537710 RepID=A0A5E4VHI9_9BURK|nr:TadE/TadG family type IV pilus assembly protein [Pandoraea terrae]VVE11732.1 pilus assembly protein TadG [Pandoraea terrae]